jgi:hypothetical protein
MSIMEINGLVLYIYHLLTYITNLNSYNYIIPFALDLVSHENH